MSQNTFRLSVRYVGFGTGRRAQYQVHINCPCNLKKSLWGTYATEQECRDAGQTSRPAYTCNKSQPVVPEEPVKKTPAIRKRITPKKPGRAEFVKDVVRAINLADINGSTYLSSGDRVIRVERENGAYKALTITDPQNNSFEFRCPFSARNAGEIATQVWNLMKTMMG